MQNQLFQFCDWKEQLMHLTRVGISRHQILDIRPVRTDLKLKIIFLRVHPGGHQNFTVNEQQTTNNKQQTTNNEHRATNYKPKIPRLDP